MREKDMEQIGRLIAKALSGVDNEGVLAEVKREVTKLCDRFPLYATRLERYDGVIGR
jgi:glycine hydroxymethyltransferase